MNKIIKTTSTNTEVKVSNILVVEIGDFSFEVDERYPWINVYQLGGECKIFVTEIDEDDMPIFSDCETLKVFALNWYFNNVEIVRKVI